MQQFWTFVKQHLGDDPSSLRLKYHVNAPEGIDVPLAITQIECRKKFGKKLAATLGDDPELLFPSVLAGEQSTSDLLAAYHATLVGEASRIVDLTAGLGIDAMHIALARPGAQVTAIDIDPAKTEALAYNAAHRGIANLLAVNADCTDIAAYAGQGDAVYFIDPARRSADGGRVYSLADCQPDAVDLMQRMPGKWRFVVKASPMLDITHTGALVPGVRQILALGTPTECKELVILADNHGEGATASPGYAVAAVTLFADGSRSQVAFMPSDERAAQPRIYGGTVEQLQGMLLYEPYPAVMKAAPFNLLSQRWGVQQLHANSHVYVAPDGGDAPKGFPGTAWLVERALPYESRHIKRLKKDYPAISVATRNFDIGADALRRKLGVRDGGSRRLLATTLASGAKAMVVLNNPATKTQGTVTL